MIISSFEGTLKPLAAKHTKDTTAQNKSEDTNFSANFDFVLNFIQNIIKQPTKEEAGNLQNKVASNSPQNSTASIPELSSELNQSENIQSPQTPQNQNKSDIPLMINANSNLFENIDKKQLDQLFKILNNNGQVRDNILKYIPEEILSYFEKNTEKSDLPHNQLNSAQIQRQISDISKIKYSDLKLIGNELRAKTEINKLSPKLDVTIPPKESPELANNLNTQNNVETLKEAVPNKSIDTKGEIPNFNFKNFPVENMKQNDNESNGKLKNNNIFDFGKIDVLNINSKDNNVLNNNQFGNRDFQNSAKQTFTSKENDLTFKDIKTIFAISNPSLSNTESVASQDKTQTFYKVQLSELPQLTNRLIQISSNQGIVRANISLYPDNLGMLFVQIEMKDGGIAMSIKAEKQTTLDKISGSIAHLIDNFNQQGLKVENIKLEQDKSAQSEEKSANNSPNNKDSNPQSKENYEKEYLQFLLRTRDSKIINI